MNCCTSLALPLLLICLLGTFVHPFNTNIQPHRPATSLYGLKKGGKFGKQKDLAAKMAEAKRLREQSDGSVAPATDMSNEEIKLQNDRKRFESLLENSMNRVDGDGLGMDYLTVQQEEENADAVYRGVARLYEGDPAPSTPFAELRSIVNGEAIGKSGVVRLVPWENNARKSDDYVVVITDPRPKSTELRSAIRRIVSGAVADEIVQRCIIVNPDSPGENRKFMKKFPGGSVADKLTVLVDEDLEWMREYTALGEKRFSMSMFVLSEGKCQKIAREVDADLITNVVTNAVKNLKDVRY